MTTGLFNYFDRTTMATSDGKAVKPWTKVDGDVRSFQRTERQRPVANMRDVSSADFTTDTAGFSLHRHPTAVEAAAFLDADDAAVRTRYYAEVEALLRSALPGISKVVMFDHTVRRNDAAAPRQPVRQVHVDQTPAAAAARVRRHVPAAEAEALLRGRYQIINVWRPIGHAATDFPLAVIDWRTMAPADLVAVDLLYPQRADREVDDDDRGKEVLPDPTSAQSTEGYEVKGETYAVAPSEGHRFYYVKDMAPDEAMFIKCFDSRSQGQPGGRDGVAGLAPHTAFVDPATPPRTKPRQSIEVRCLVFYE